MYCRQSAERILPFESITDFAVVQRRGGEPGRLV